MWHIAGKLEWIPLYIILLLLIIVRFKKQSAWIILAIIVLITLSDIISTRLIKDIVERYRPSHNPELEGLVHLVKNYHGGNYGFVSSHAANTFALATFVSLLFKNKWLSGGLFIWAGIVSYSRIYLGVHYPGDILAGACLGILLAILVSKAFRTLWQYYLNRKLFRKNEQPT